jgi:hypothetical protein
MAKNEIIREPEYTCNKLDRLIILIHEFAKDSDVSNVALEEALELVDELRIANHNLRAWGRQYKALVTTDEVNNVYLMDNEIAKVCRKMVLKARPPLEPKKLRKFNK